MSSEIHLNKNASSEAKNFKSAQAAATKVGVIRLSRLAGSERLRQIGALAVLAWMRRLTYHLGIMNGISIMVGLIIAMTALIQTHAGEYKTKRGNATLIVTTATRAKGVLQVQAELQPRNAARIDRAYLATPSGKKLKPSEKTTFAEQKIEGDKGKEEQVELDTQQTSGTYLANAYLFELPENEKKGRWFFYAQGAGSRGQEAGFRVEIPAKDVEAAMKGEKAAEK